MTVFTKTAVDIFAAHDSSGAKRKVANHDVQVWGTEVERAIKSFQAGGGVVFDSKTEADGSLDYNAYTMAWVFDVDPDKAGIYQKQGASGSGSWQRVGDLPYSFILATNSNSGNPNAIDATTAIPIPAADGGALIALPIVADNTASPVSVSFNGGPALTIKTIAGNDVPIAALAAGMIVWGFKQGDEFRLATDLSSAAIQAAAEAAAAEAEAARDVATGAMTTVIDPQFSTIATAEAYSPDVAPDYIRTAGYAAAGDGGGALYKKAASEPSHAGKFSITLADGETVVWYEIAETVLRPEMFGATVNAGSDQQAALQAMLDVGSPEIYLPSGIWRSDTSLTRSTDVCIRGPGTLDFSNGTSGQLLIQGSITALDNLNADVTKHSRTLSWASSQGLAAGDIVILWNPTDYSFGGRRAVYRDGGMFKVHSLPTATTVKTYEMAVDAYTAASMNVYKLNPVRVTIEGIRVKPCSTTEAAPIKISFGADVVIRDVKSLAGGTYGGIQIDRCYNVVYDCTTPENNSPHEGNEYGIIISNSQHVKVQGAAAFATRHAVTLGGTDSEASVPCRYVTISGMSLWNAPATGIGAGDVHGNGDYVTYSNCVMAGFSGGGRNIRLIGCTVFGMPELTSGMCVTMPETNGGYIEFIDCEFISEGDGNQSGAHGYILVQAIGPGGGGAPAETHIREKVYIRILNCRMITPNAHTNAKAVFVQGINADKNIQVLIDGLEWVAPQGLAFLFARDTVLAALPSDYLVVDNVVGPSGAYLIYPDADIAAVPTREMAQRGKVIHTTTAAALNAAAAQSFRYKYSRMPTAQVAVSDDTGSNIGQVAGKSACPVIYNLTTNSIRPGIQSADNAAFTAGTDVALHWSVGVMEV